jgi:hypothetical protein
MTGIYLNPIEAAAVNRHHGALNIDEIILAQIRCPLSQIA